MARSKTKEPGRSRDALNARYARFVTAYLADPKMNATAAAIKAGYSGRTAMSQASRLLTVPKIQQAIAERRAKMLNKYELSAETVVRELARIAFFDVANCLNDDGSIKPLNAIDEDTRRALSGYEEGKIKAWNKIDAIGKALAYLDLLPRGSINVSAVAQSAAVASQVNVEAMSDLEIARRIAFVLGRVEACDTTQ